MKLLISSAPELGCCLVVALCYFWQWRGKQLVARHQLRRSKRLVTETLHQAEADMEQVAARRNPFHFTGWSKW